MRYWRSLYEILAFPIEVLLFAFAILGIGNLLTNEAFSFIINIDNEFVLLLAECMVRVGSFLIVQFPFLFLLRLVTRKAGSATTILSSVAGYVTYLVVTMAFASTDFSSTAYSSILGISMNVAGNLTMKAGVRYPLQTGVVATAVVAMITLNSYKASRSRNEYGVFSFLSKETYCVIRTVILSGIAAIVVTYFWPYVMQAINAVITFISNDTTNPVNLGIYGILDRALSVINLSTLVRNPFWYGSNGGSWISMAGGNVAGDVNIWTQQLVSSTPSGMAGRFITPYYILNIFGMPGLLWAVFTQHTDRLERRKILVLFIIMTLISMLGGSILPIEITLLLLCPLLFFIHLGITGILFGLCQSMQIYLGFNYTGSSTISALPGTLFEYLSYFQYSSMRSTLLKIAIIGAITFAVYFIVTKFYFRFLALDLFHTGVKDEIINGTIEAVGGVENIKLIHSSDTRVVISLYDPTVIQVSKLLDLGAVRVTEVKAGFAIAYGGGSCMIHKGIAKKMKESIRSQSRMN